MSLSPPPLLGPALYMTEKYSIPVSGGENWGEGGTGCTSGESSIWGEYICHGHFTLNANRNKSTYTCMTFSNLHQYNILFKL